MKAKYFKINGQTIIKTSNMKVGEDTLIYNMGSAKYCPNRKTCPYGKDGSCYGDKSERLYPNCLPYKLRQKEYWNNTDKFVIAMDFLSITSTNPQIRFIRFNETGDMETKEDFIKLNYIADFFKPYGIKVYTYTHSHKLIKTLKDSGDYNKYKSDNLVLNGSDVMIDNNFKVVSKDYKPKPTEKQCAMKCLNCNLCKTANKQTILVVIH